jgi:hypothetical protein
MARIDIGEITLNVEERGHCSYRRHWQAWNPIVDAFLRENEGRV